MILGISINSVEIVGVGNKNIDDDKDAKMPIFSFIRKLNKCIGLLFMQLIFKTESFSYIDSLDFTPIFYVTKLGQFHIS